MRFLAVAAILFIITNVQAEPLNYLNNIRAQAGLAPLTLNPALTKSANNHAIYIHKHGFSAHYQDKRKAYFTGYAPVDRATYVGYPSLLVLENVSDGQKDYKESIDGLMSAIYHRFGFLNFQIDEIGLARQANYYVYNMGYSKLRQLCEMNHQINGSYYQPCADKSKQVPQQAFDAVNQLLLSKLQPVVVYPVASQTNVKTVFYEEIPDPLPDRSVSGYPISVQFNEHLVKDVKLQSFKLYKNCQTEVVKTRLLTKTSDPNQVFTAHEFALFPLDRLEFGTLYCVDFKFLQNNRQRTLSWRFETEDLDNLIDVKQDARFSIESGKTYHFNIKPWDINKITNNINYTYVSTVKIEKVEFLDHYVIIFKATGKSGDRVNLSLGKRKLELIFN